jgi:hypothetical protein
VSNITPYTELRRTSASALLTVLYFKTHLIFVYFYILILILYFFINFSQPIKYELCLVQYKRENEWCMFIYGFMFYILITLNIAPDVQNSCVDSGLRMDHMSLKHVA